MVAKWNQYIKFNKVYRIEFFKKNPSTPPPPLKERNNIMFYFVSKIEICYWIFNVIFLKAS